MSGSISGTSATTFGYTGAIVQATVSTTGAYYIIADGGRGGSAVYGPDGANSGAGGSGGNGAIIGGEFTLTANESLSILVAGAGQGAPGVGYGGAAGGGGTFVVGPGTTPLVIAGGGGGGSAAQAGTFGLPALAKGGGGGLGGIAYNGGGGGGGLIGNGGSAPDGGGGGGLSFVNGGAGGEGGAHGGFGGGGGGSDTAGGVGGTGGGYTGGRGYILIAGAGGTSFDAGRDTLYSNAYKPGPNGLVTITPLFASTIALGGSGQTITTGTTPVTPFTGVSITDPDGANPADAKGPTETVTVTPSATTHGTLADPNQATDGSSLNSSTGAVTLTGSAAAVAADLAALTFTPASGQPSDTSFTVADTNWAGLTSNAVTASVIVTVPSVITVPAADPLQPTAGGAVMPFAGVTITDPNGGNPANFGGATETVTVTPNSVSGGLFLDPSQATDGSVVGSNGSITYDQTASAVTNWLDQLLFVPSGSPSITSFTIADTNWTGLTTTASAAISVLVNEPSSILGTQSDQATTDESPVKPFAHVTISDPNGAAVTDTAEIFLGTDANGALSGTGLTKTGTGTYTLAARPATLTSELDALVFTPTPHQVAPGQTVETGFTIVDFNSFSGIPAVDSTTSVVATVVSTSPIVGRGAPSPVTSVASIITVPAADQARTSIGQATVKPFAGVTIADANAGSPTETVTVTPSATTIGRLADPNLASDGTGTNIITGALTLKGSATAVTTALDALTFIPRYGQSGQTSFSIADQNSAGQTTAPPATAAVTINLPMITTAQLHGVGTDVLQFYTDELTGQHIAAGASKLASDFTSLDISQPELGQLLGQALISATLGSTAATTLGLDIAGLYYPKIATDLSASNNVGLATDLTKMVVTTVGAGTDDLLRRFSGQSASHALTGAVQDLSKLI